MPASRWMSRSRRATRRPAGVEAIAIGADRSREHERQPGRAVFEVMQGLAVGGRRIGVLDARHDLPGRARCAAGHRPRGGIAAVERLDGQAIIGLRHQPALERGALEHPGNELEPVARGWLPETPRQRKCPDRRSWPQIATSEPAGQWNIRRRLPVPQAARSIIGAHRLVRHVWRACLTAAAFRCRRRRAGRAHRRS